MTRRAVNYLLGMYHGGTEARYLSMLMHTIELAQMW